MVEPELFDGENFMELSADFVDFVGNAAPHVQEHFMMIRSPLTLDVYQWLTAKLYAIDQEMLFPWAWAYAQFGQGGKLNPSQMKDLRRKLKAALLDIRQNYYPAARIEATEEGLILRRSPPLVEPDDKRAGYLI